MKTPSLLLFILALVSGCREGCHRSTDPYEEFPYERCERPQEAIDLAAVYAREKGRTADRARAGVMCFPSWAALDSEYPFVVPDEVRGGEAPRSIYLVVFPQRTPGPGGELLVILRAGSDGLRPVFEARFID